MSGSGSQQVGVWERIYAPRPNRVKLIFAGPSKGILMAKTSKPEAAPADYPYLENVRLRGLAPLNDVKTSFKAGLNVIIGKNGAGKTSFMKLLSQLANLYTDNYRGVGCEFTIGGRRELNVRFIEQEIVVKKSNQHQSSQFISQPLPLLAVASSGQQAKKHEILGEAISKLTGGYFDYSVVSVWHGLPTHRLPVIDDGADLKLSKISGLALENHRETRQVMESRLVSAILTTVGVNYNSLLIKKNNESASLDLVRSFIERAVDVHLNRLNAYLPIYSPIQAVRRSKLFQVYSNSVKDELIVKGLVLEYLIGEDWLPFSALSDGTKRLFYLIGELMTAVSTVMNKERTEFIPLKADKIIFLEEPELGIHPDQLQLLLQLIREVSKEHQIIMTTHSPQTLDMLSAQELDRITICEFIPGKGTQMRKLSTAKKNKAKAYLRDSGFLSEFWRFSNLEDPD